MKNSLFFWVSCTSIFLAFASCLENKKVNDDSEIQYKGKVQSIVSSDFNRFILLKTTSRDYCKYHITEYCELDVLEDEKDSAKNFNIQHFRIAQKNMWIIVEVPKTLDFYSFHNLVAWMWNEGVIQDLPSEVVGISLNRVHHNQSYYVELDNSNKWGDVVVGADKKGNSLSVYLPEAYLEGGNLRVEKDNNHKYSSLISDLYTAGIDFGAAQNLIWEDFDVKLYY